jgi:arabinogalactan endo-1,4-beta-galactosidase
MFNINRIVFFLLIFTAINCGKKTVTPTPIDPIPVVPTTKGYTWDKFSMGADLSYVNEIQDAGGVYKDSNVVKDPFVIFKNHGTNTVRVRLWHNPTWKLATSNGKLYSDLYDVEKTIKRAKAAGMAVNLDIHYSDDWADPAKQEVPVAWKNATATSIKDSVYNYTLSVLNYLKSKNLTPEMVQIGNENNNGMVHPFGKPVSNSYKAFADIVNSGIKAVRDFSQNSTIKPQIIIHVAQLQNADWWTNNVITLGGVSDFDIIGLSHYAKWSTVATMEGIGTVIKNLKTKFNKKVMIVETAFPWTEQNGDNYTNLISAGVGDYKVSQTEHLRYMKDLTQTVISAGGTGIMYWEPAWITSPMKDRWGSGSSWENQAYFDFSGNTLPIIDWMIADYKF